MNKVVAPSVLLLVIAFVLIFNQLSDASRMIETRTNTCVLIKQKGEDDRFQIRFIGDNKKNSFYVKKVVYRFTPRFGDKNNIEIYNRSGRLIWQSPDSLISSSYFAHYPQFGDAGFSLPTREVLLAKGIGDRGSASDPSCIASFRL